MRVLHYRKSFSQLTETFIYDYILELERQGVDNYVVTHNHVHKIDRPFDKVLVVSPPYRWNPERLGRRAIDKVVGNHSKKANWTLTRRKIRKAVKKIKPDIIHAHFGREGVIISEVAYKLKIPLVISFHGFDAFKLTQNKFWVRKYKKIDSEQLHITCVSEYMKDYLSGFFSKSCIEVIHVSKDLSSYKYSKPTSKIKKWISIGRLTLKKGHEDTIISFAKILKKYPEQSLKIIGEGPQRKKLQNLIDQKKISDNVKLLGSISHEKVIEELGNAEAFILSSKTTKENDMEGIPTVLMEAQAMGLPCVSTWHSGIPEVIPEKNRFLLCNEGDVANITQKIVELINSSEDALIEISKRGREIIEKEFSLDKEIKKLIKIYNNHS